MFFYLCLLGLFVVCNACDLYMELAKKYGVDGTNTMSNNASNEGLNEGLNLSDKENKIIELIKEKGQLSSKEIIVTTGFSHATVERAVKRLSEELLLIKREGSKKTGYWKMITEEK